MWCVLWGLGVVFIITGRRGHERRGRGDRGLKSLIMDHYTPAGFTCQGYFLNLMKIFYDFLKKAGQPSNARAWDHHANASASHNASGRTQSARRHKRTHTRHQHITALCGLVAHSGRRERSRSLPDVRNQRKRAKKPPLRASVRDRSRAFSGGYPRGTGTRAAGRG